MPRGIRKKTRQYVLERFQDEDPESFFKFRSQSSRGLSHEQMEFLEALSNQSVNVVKGFLNRGLDPNFTILPERHTPLHLALLEHRPGVDDVTTEKIVGALLFFGADPNAQDGSGNTPLHTCCMCCPPNPACAQLLLQAGARVNCLNWNHESVLQVSCSLKDPSLALVSQLVDGGADTHITTSGSQNLLHLLCSADMCRLCDFETRAGVARHLMEQGVPCDPLDTNGKTPLCYELLRLVYLLSTAHSAPDLPPPSIPPHSTQVALTLVQGGALTNFHAHKDDIWSLMDTLSLFPQAPPSLREFLLCVRDVLPMSDVNLMCRWLARPSRHSALLPGTGQYVPEHPVIVPHDGHNDGDRGRVGRVERGGGDWGDGGGRVGRAERGGDGQRMAVGASNVVSESEGEHQYPANSDGVDDDGVSVNVNGRASSSSVYESLVLHSPPSLLSTARVAIRGRLGGRLTVTASLLGLPSKMQDYIRTLP